MKGEIKTDTLLQTLFGFELLEVESSPEKNCSERLAPPHGEIVRIVREKDIQKTEMNYGEPNWFQLKTILH